MKCQHVTVGNTSAIVCTGGRTRRCACGHPAGMLCDWKIGRGTTCDRPMCETHATEVGTNKHLCPSHAKTWEAHPANPNGIARAEG